MPGISPTAAGAVSNGICAIVGAVGRNELIAGTHGAAGRSWVGTGVKRDMDNWVAQATTAKLSSSIRVGG